MSKPVSFVCLVLLSVMLIASCGSPAAEQPPRTVFDTALAMLCEFVAEGDSSLGFRSIDSMRGAYIDTTHGIPIVFAREDSLLQNGLVPGTLTLEHRIVFPVYVGNTLHSAITFDSVLRERRIEPVGFEAGIDFEEYWYLAKQSPTGFRSMIVEAPFFQSTFYFGLEKGGMSTIALPSELAKRIGMKTSPDNFSNTEAFVTAAKTYLKNLHGVVRIRTKGTPKN